MWGLLGLSSVVCRLPTVLRACTAVRDGYAKIEEILPSTLVFAASRR